MTSVRDRLPADYGDWLTGLTDTIRQAWLRASLTVSAELIGLYWCIGRDILDRQDRGGWAARWSSAWPPICGPSSPTCAACPGRTCSTSAPSPKRGSGPYRDKPDWQHRAALHPGRPAGPCFLRVSAMSAPSSRSARLALVGRMSGTADRMRPHVTSRSRATVVYARPRRCQRPGLPGLSHRQAVRCQAFGRSIGVNACAGTTRPLRPSWGRSPRPATMTGTP